MDNRVTLNKLPYYNQNTLIQKQAIERLANLSDGEIAQISAINAQEKANKSKAAKAQKLLLPAAIGTVVTAGVLQAGPRASSKILTGAAGLASFALLHKAFDTASKAMSKITSRSDKDPQTQRDLNCIGTIAGGAALYELGTTGIVKGIKSLKKHFPHSALELNEKINKFDKIAADSKFADNFKKFVSNPMKKLTSKLPEGFTKFLGKYTAPIALGAFVAGSFFIANKIENQKMQAYNQNVDNLLSSREEAKVAADMLNNAESNYDEAFCKDEFEADNEKIIETADKGKDIDAAISESLDKAVENIQD